MPTAAPVPTTDDMLPFWRFYRFKDANKEDNYRDACVPGDLHACWVFAIFHSWLHISLPLLYVQNELPFQFYVPPILQVILGITVLVFSFVLAFQKHMKLIVCLIGPVLGVIYALGISWHSTLLLQGVRQSKIPFIFELAEGHRQLLDECLTTLVTSLVVVRQTLTVIPLFLIHTYIGLCPHTIASWTAFQIAMWSVFAAVGGFSGFGDMLVHVAGQTGGVSIMAVFSFIVATQTRRLSFSLLVSFEEVCAREALQSAAEAGRKADSILNHTLKNTMADAAGEIMLFFEEVKTRGQDPNPELQRAVASLQRGMRFCQHRQALIQLVTGAYPLAL